MTAACFFRYAWIAPERFEALLPPSSSLERLAGHLRSSPVLDGALPESALRSGAIARLHGFASRPSLRALPARSLIRSAARWAAAQGEPQAEQLAGWCAALRDRLDDCVDADADDGRDGAFLDELARTDFPVLLLWSNPELARYLFVRDGSEVRLAPALRRESQGAPEGCDRRAALCAGQLRPVRPPRRLDRIGLRGRRRPAPAPRASNAATSCCGSSPISAGRRAPGSPTIPAASFRARTPGAMSAAS